MEFVVVKFSAPHSPIAALLATLLSANAVANDAPRWTDHIEFSGLVEFEAGYADPYEGDSESDFALATAEFGISAAVNDHISADVVFLYEEDDTDLDVDTATLTIAFDDTWYSVAGKQYVPFGSYDTRQISDPLTLEMAEMLETAVMVGFEANGFNGAAYAFNGDLDESGDSQIDSFGASLGYSFEAESSAFSANLRYANNLGDSDALTDVMGDDIEGDYVGAVAADLALQLGDWVFLGEYVAATDEFDTPNNLALNGAEPSAWHVEVGYDFALSSLPASFAVAYQGSDEAVALELPEQRLMATLSAEVYEGTSLALEYAYDTDYDTRDGGTDDNASTVTLQLAYEF